MMSTFGIIQVPHNDPAYLPQRISMEVSLPSSNVDIFNCSKERNTKWSFREKILR